MIYHVQWRRPGGSWKWLTGWGLMEDRDLPAEDARKMTRSEAEAAVRNLTSGPKNVRGEDIQYEARVVPQGGSGSPTRGRGAGLFVVRSNSGKVVGRYHTKAEAEHCVQQLKAGAARLRPFQFTSRSPSRVYGPLGHAEQLVHDYRTENPKSRAQGILKLVKNTSATKQRGCVLCGATGPTWSGQYPETKRAREWAAEHVKQHLGAHSPMRGRSPGKPSKPSVLIDPTIPLTTDAIILFESRNVDPGNILAHSGSVPVRLLELSLNQIGYNVPVHISEAHGPSGRFTVRWADGSEEPITIKVRSRK